LIGKGVPFGSGAGVWLAHAARETNISTLKKSFFMNYSHEQIVFVKEQNQFLKTKKNRMQMRFYICC